jgi:hypothetical protein
MTAERWKRLKPLLETALELEPFARAAYVASVTQDDGSLGDDLQGLLRGSEQAGFLDAWQVGRPPSSPEHLPRTPPSRAGSVDAVDLVALPPYTQLAIATRHRQYHMMLVSAVTLEAVVTGGRHWPEPTTVFVKQDTLRVGERVPLLHGTKRVSFGPCLKHQGHVLCRCIGHFWRVSGLNPGNLARGDDASYHSRRGPRHR